MVSWGRLLEDSQKPTKLGYKTRQSMTRMGRPFPDILSCDPHNNSVRYGDQVTHQRRSMNLGEVRQLVQNQDLGVLPPTQTVVPIDLTRPPSRSSVF